MGAARSKDGSDEATDKNVSDTTDVKQCTVSGTEFPFSSAVENNLHYIDEEGIGVLNNDEINLEEKEEVEVEESEPKHQNGCCGSKQKDEKHAIQMVEPAESKVETEGEETLEEDTTQNDEIEGGEKTEHLEDVAENTNGCGSSKQEQEKDANDQKRKQINHSDEKASSKKGAGTSDTGGKEGAGGSPKKKKPGPPPKWGWFPNPTSTTPMWQNDYKSDLDFDVVNATSETKTGEDK